MGTAAQPSSSPSTSGSVGGVLGVLAQAAGGGGGNQARSPSTPREFRFTSEVPIWLDYHGKHVTMDQVVSGAVPRSGCVRHPSRGSPLCPGVAGACIRAVLAAESVPRASDGLGGTPNPFSFPRARSPASSSA